jgi:hypothetical protein
MGSRPALDIRDAPSDQRHPAENPVTSSREPGITGPTRLDNLLHRLRLFRRNLVIGDMGDGETRPRGYDVPEAAEDHVSLLQGWTGGGLGATLVLLHLGGPLELRREVHLQARYNRIYVRMQDYH